MGPLRMLIGATIGAAAHVLCDAATAMRRPSVRDRLAADCAYYHAPLHARPLFYCRHYHVVLSHACIYYCS
jgi:hypothetical protein